MSDSDSDDLMFNATLMVFKMIFILIKIMNTKNYDDYVWSVSGAALLRDFFNINVATVRHRLSLFGLGNLICALMAIGVLGWWPITNCAIDFELILNILHMIELIVQLTA